MRSHLIPGKRTEREDGQALVEFALTLPILLLFIMGLIDFSVVLFSYSQAQNSLRTALRYAQLIGYVDDPHPYLNCDEMRDRAGRSFFATTHTVDIQYVKADGSGGPYTCNTVTNDLLSNGDMLQMNLVARIDPFFLPFDQLTMDFNGQRSIVKMISVAYDPETTPPDPPAKPENFTAMPVVDENGECVTGEVEFTWTPMSPRPTKVDIHKADSGSLLFTVDPAMNAYCNDDCDFIDPDLGYRCYYAVAYSYSVPGPESDVTCAYCIKEPSAPTNFTATKDCLTGNVSFSWNWGDGSPPTRAEIRNAADDSVVEVLDKDLFDTTCVDCDTIPLPGARSYYIVAINAIGGEQRVGPPSNIAAVECTLLETTSVSGYIQQDLNTLGDCQDFGAGISGQQVSLTGTSSSHIAITEADGFFAFGGLEPDTYTMQLPPGLNYTAYTSTDDGLCHSMVSPMPPITVDLTDGGAVQFTIGYQP